jgi:hypothetical protein
MMANVGFRRAAGRAMATPARCRARAENPHADPTMRQLVDTGPQRLDPQPVHPNQQHGLK